MTINKNIHRKLKFRSKTKWEKNKITIKQWKKTQKSYLFWAQCIWEKIPQEQENITVWLCGYENFMNLRNQVCPVAPEENQSLIHNHGNFQRLACDSSSQRCVSVWERERERACTCVCTRAWCLRDGRLVLKRILVFPKKLKEIMHI